MQDAVIKAGKTAQIVAINLSNATADVKNLSDKTKAPVFQDTTEVDAVGQHGVTKDDVLIYDSKGLLVAYLPYAGAVNTTLTVPEGFAAVLAALVAAP